MSLELAYSREELLVIGCIGVDASAVDELAMGSWAGGEVEELALLLDPQNRGIL